jgi:hypothetical protein
VTATAYAASIDQKLPGRLVPGSLLLFLVCVSRPEAIQSVQGLGRFPDRQWLCQFVRRMTRVD